MLLRRTVASALACVLGLSSALAVPTGTGPAIPVDKIKAQPPQYLSLRALGTSITAGCCVTANGAPWVTLLGQSLGVVPNNLGISGSLMADQQPGVYGQAVSENASQLYTLDVGTNEGAFYGTASNRQLTFQALHQASLAWLALPEGAKVRGQAAASTVAVSSVTSNGTGGNATVATVTTTTAHGFSAGQAVTLSGAAQSAYNVTAPITVTGANSFTIPVFGTPVTPATGTITATGPGIVYSAGWTADNAVLASGVSMKSSTSGATATFKTFGPVAYLAYGMQTGDAGSFSVTVDGTAYGSFSTNGVSGGFSTTPQNTTHGSALARLSGLSNAPHTIVVTVTSATGAGNVWVDWVSGAGTPAASGSYGGPTVIAVAPPQQGNGGSTSALYGSLALADVGVLAQDGLNVIWADTPGFMNPGTDLLPDNTHPNDRGHARMRDAILAALNTASTARGKSALIGALNATFRGTWLPYGSTLTNVGTGNNIIGGSTSGTSSMLGSGNDNIIVGGYSNSVGGGGAGNTYANALVGGRNNAAQFGGMNGLLGGEGNVAQGFRNCILAGQGSKIFGSNSCSLGGFGADDRSRYAWVGTGFGQFAAFTTGGAQTGYQGLWGASSSTTPVRLTANGATASAANSVGIPLGAVYHLVISATCRDTTSGDYAVWNPRDGVLSRKSTGSASYVGAYSSASTPDHFSGAGSTASLIVVSDTTNNAASVSATMPNSNAWRCVSKAETREEVQ